MVKPYFLRNGRKVGYSNLNGRSNGNGNVVPEFLPTSYLHLGEDLVVYDGIKDNGSSWVVVAGVKVSEPRLLGESELSRAIDVEPVTDFVLGLRVAAELRRLGYRNFTFMP